MSWLTDKINEKINEWAREAARDQAFGASIVDIKAKVNSSPLDSNLVTIATTLSIDCPDFNFEFNGVGGMILPRGGYTLTVTVPYCYQESPDDNITDVIAQEYERIRMQLKEAFKSVVYNPERNPGKLPPKGTILTRQLLVGFKGQFALEKAGIEGEVICQYTVEHLFEEHGEIKLCIKENILQTIGGKPKFAINDLSIAGGALFRNVSEQGIQLTVDVLGPGDGGAQLKQEADRRLLAQTVRFNEKGVPQAITNPGINL